MYSEQQHGSGSRAQALDSSDPKIGRVVGAPLTEPRADPGKPRCLGLTKQGKSCGGTPTTSSGGRWCPGHDPRFSPEQRKAWRQRGALSLHHRRLVKERAAVVQQAAVIVAQLPADVPLPPVPDPEAPDWSDATKIRLYLQNLAAQVAAGKLPTSVAKALRELADSTLKVVDIEVDAMIAERLVKMQDAETPRNGRPDVRIVK